MAEIRFEHVSKRFGKVLAVNDLNLTVRDREFLTLVGPSGCGKSTTLSLLAGLDDPSEGLIYIDDRVVNDVPPGARDIAMVFQSYALYPHMTVRENIGFGLRVRGMPRAEIERRVQEAAAILGISDLLDRKPRALSGGQRQRVALGRAITRNPKVFLLDEPLSNLDAQLRVQMRAELKLLFDRVRGTVVYVTHDQAEAMTLSERLVVMQWGLVQQVGTPLEVYNRPRNVFVAGFLGSPTINLIRCEMEVAEDHVGLAARDFHWTFRPASRAQAAAATSRRVIFGVRPEDVKVSVGEGGDGVPARVEVTEHMGAFSIVYATTGSDRVAAIVGAESQVRIGDTVRLAFDNHKVHLFDHETEENLLVREP